MNTKLIYSALVLLTGALVTTAVHLILRDSKVTAVPATPNTPPLKGATNLIDALVRLQGWLSESNLTMNNIMAVMWLDYQNSWHNTTGYFDGLVEGKHGNRTGQLYMSYSPGDNSRMMFIMPYNETKQTVWFQRYTNDNSEWIRQNNNDTKVMTFAEVIAEVGVI